ncbi:tetratricopeptide repeat protein [Sunxiuqinia dokdonensis]|uniref:hypothetical protein n=1 Tax=Sunxiuqinia dokdonensis TaxID=1409788 RepID=UPI0012FB2B19|nr:hypothetical protein [Sunxiuqinia dokdonensis]
MEKSYPSRIMTLVTVVLLMLALGASGADREAFRCQFHQAYLKGDMSQWLQWAEEIESAHPNDREWILLALQARYGLIGYYFGTEQDDQVKPVLNEANDHLDDLLKRYPGDARLLSLQGAFQAFKIGLAKYKAPFLGPKVEASVQQALKLDPNEPMAWLEAGNSLYNRPALFGGDKLQAIEAYKKSLALFEQGDETCNYLKVLVQVFIMKGYFETGQRELYQRTRQQLENEYGKLPWLDDFLPATMLD